MAAAAKYQNQRSWKNYLLNKRYQLRFTLFMTGLSAILMGLLGWWVKTQASKATEIAINNVYGSADLKQCDRPELGEFGVSAPAPAWKEPEAAEAAPEPARDEEPAAPAEEVDDTADLGDDEDDPLGWEDDGSAADGAPRVVLGDIEGDIDALDATAPSAGAVTSEEVAAYYECRMEQAIELAALVGPIYRGERQITAALVAVGIFLLVGITLYGIVMTHRVAGPLYKISLYLNKLREGRYDTVYNLRKGDHLIEFYEVFKRAHAGLRQMQEEDLARLREAVAIAEREGLADKSTELAKVIEEMRALADEKESSLG